MLITNLRNSTRLIKLKEVIQKTSLGHSSIYKFISEGTFPKQVSLGAKSVAWLESEVDDWIMERLGERDN
ncbi:MULTISPECIES: AlpA family transcriptional regulator [Pseudoalteromonas]|uniref:AlpA family transcriptional regulator n=1 Tax=Pseudoalteromonas TaxID=53246 RepID=UPI001F2256AB|nr:AlpA family transcriptional regulator [Pseudoalteromonas sp. ND6B]